MNKPLSIVMGTVIVALAGLGLSDVVMFIYKHGSYAQLNRAAIFVGMWLVILVVSLMSVLGLIFILTVILHGLAKLAESEWGGHVLVTFFAVVYSCIASALYHWLRHSLV